MRGLYRVLPGLPLSGFGRGEADEGGGGGGRVGHQTTATVLLENE